MITLKRGSAWLFGCVVFTFILSVGLSWLTYGYVDLRTVSKMGLVLLSVLILAVYLIFHWFD